MSKQLATAEIDWAKLAEELGLEAPFGDYCCGSKDAQRALELVIGEASLRAAVDYYVAGRPGSELARLALCQLRPWSAMRRCYEIFKGAYSAEARRMAVELLRALADGRALVWIPEFLSDEDALIQTWGVGVLDQLLWSESIEAEDAEAILRLAEQHGNDSVRERAEFIRGYLLSRAEQERHADGPCSEG